MYQDGCNKDYPRGGSKMNLTRLIICVMILVAIAFLEAGFILGRWEFTDRDGRLSKHETQIEMQRIEIKAIKEKLRMP